MLDTSVLSVAQWRTNLIGAINVASSQLMQSSAAVKADVGTKEWAIRDALSLLGIIGFGSDVSSLRGTGLQSTVADWLKQSPLNEAPSALTPTLKKGCIDFGNGVLEVVMPGLLSGDGNDFAVSLKPGESLSLGFRSSFVRFQLPVALIIVDGATLVTSGPDETYNYVVALDQRRDTFTPSSPDRTFQLIAHRMTPSAITRRLTPRLHDIEAVLRRDLKMKPVGYQMKLGSSGKPASPKIEPEVINPNAGLTAFQGPYVVGDWECASEALGRARVQLVGA